MAVDLGGYLPDLVNALDNFSKSFDSLAKVVNGLAWVIGLLLMVKGIIGLRHLSMHMSPHGGKNELSGSLIYIVVGSVLVFLPNSLGTGLNTIFGGEGISAASGLIGYSSLATTANWQNLLDVLQKYVKLIGYIAFIRGWMIIAKTGQSGAQPGTLGKGITHVVAGILLVNIVGALNILANTFGIKPS